MLRPQFHLSRSATVVGNQCITGGQKENARLLGQALKVLKVELRGVEPRSKQETNMVSTCLSVYWLSGSGWQAAADLNLIPLRVRFDPGKGRPAILV